MELPLLPMAFPALRLVAFATSKPFAVSQTAQVSRTSAAGAPVHRSFSEVGSLGEGGSILRRWNLAFGDDGLVATNPAMREKAEMRASAGISVLASLLGRLLGV
jgi:hypothetical protein